jgi:hypothetical protein
VQPFFVTHFAHPQPNAGAAGGSLTEALLLGGWVGVFFWLHLVFKHVAIRVVILTGIRHSISGLYLLTNIYDTSNFLMYVDSSFIY